jgi:signal transduction histidine kinase
MSLRAVREITGALLGGEQLDVVLQLVAAHARKVSRADVAMITAVGERQAEAVVVVAVGRDAARLRGRRGTQAELLHGFGPSVRVPLEARDRNYGTLVVANRVGKSRFAPEEVELVETFAQQAALAFDAVRRANRERLGRDMYDDVIQRLYAAGLTLETLTDADLAPEVADRIAKTVEALDATIREIRGAIFPFEPGRD